MSGIVNPFFEQSNPMLAFRLRFHPSPFKLLVGLRTWVWNSQPQEGIYILLNHEACNFIIHVVILFHGEHFLLVQLEKFKSQMVQKKAGECPWWLPFKDQISYYVFQIKKGKLGYCIFYTRYSLSNYHCHHQFHHCHDHHHHHHHYLLWAFGIKLWLELLEKIYAKKELFFFANGFIDERIAVFPCFTPSLVWYKNEKFLIVPFMSK